MPNFIVREVTENDGGCLLEGYRLLQQALGARNVESFDCFRSTVSPATDSCAVPRMVCALDQNEVIGFSVGAYLRNLNMGIIVYSGVKTGWRRRGVYTAVRGELIDLFNQSSDEARREGLASGRRIACVVSEQEDGSELFKRYVAEWGAHVAPCDYEQPEVHGLTVRPLKLVLQPVGRNRPPTANEVIELVRELYERLYRIADVDHNPSYLRVVASVQKVQTSEAVRA